jgi:hypothetical protein
MGQQGQSAVIIIWFRVPLLQYDCFWRVSQKWLSHTHPAVACEVGGGGHNSKRIKVLLVPRPDKVQRRGKVRKGMGLQYCRWEQPPK